MKKIAVSVVSLAVIAGAVVWWVRGGSGADTHRPPTGETKTTTEYSDARRSGFYDLKRTGPDSFSGTIVLERGGAIRLFGDPVFDGGGVEIIKRVVRPLSISIAEQKITFTMTEDGSTHTFSIPAPEDSTLSLLDAIGAEGHRIPFATRNMKNGTHTTIGIEIVPTVIE